MMITPLVMIMWSNGPETDGNGNGADGGDDENKGDTNKDMMVFLCDSSVMLLSFILYSESPYIPLVCSNISFWYFLTHIEFISNAYCLSFYYHCFYYFLMTASLFRK